MPTSVCCVTSKPLEDEELSRRKRVAIEDDISATRLSSVRSEISVQVLWA